MGYCTHIIPALRKLRENSWDWAQPGLCSKTLASKINKHIKTIWLKGNTTELFPWGQQRTAFVWIPAYCCSIPSQNTALASSHIYILIKHWSWRGAFEGSNWYKWYRVRNANYPSLINTCLHNWNITFGPINMYNYYLLIDGVDISRKG